MASIESAQRTTSTALNSLVRYLRHARRRLAGGRHMTTAERRALQRAAFDDPRVESSLRELLTERPELRKNSSNVGVRDRLD